MIATARRLAPREVHRYLWTNRALYRLCGRVAPVALIIAIAAGAGDRLWPSAKVPPSSPPWAQPAQPNPVPAPKPGPVPAPQPVSPSASDVRSLYDRVAQSRDQAAFNDLGILAKRGSVEAQDFLGRLYENGKVIPANLYLAASLFSKAAKQGNDDAERRLETLKKGEFTAHVLTVLDPRTLLIQRPHGQPIPLKLYGARARRLGLYTREGKAQEEGRLNDERSRMEALFAESGDTVACFPLVAGSPPEYRCYTTTNGVDVAAWAVGSGLAKSIVGETTAPQQPR